MGKINITLNITKSDVYDDIDASTHYAGDKGESSDNPGNFHRVSTVKADRTLLEKWFGEACTLFADRVKEFMTSYANTTAGFSVALEISSAFDETLQPSIEASLKTFFVDFILAKWYSMTSTEAAAKEQGDSAGLMLEDIMAKLYHRKRPTKRTD